MDKAVLKLFGFLKSSAKFVKILLMFCILMLILYWIQDLTNDTWGWTTFMSRFLDFFLDMGSYIAPGSIHLFAALFEFKYLVAGLIFIAFYILTHLVYLGLGVLEEAYNDGCRVIRKMEEDRFNKSLEKRNISDQKKISKYQIYVETQQKSAFGHREFNIDMEEQNQIMLKFLIKKIGIVPDKFENGYLFTFNSFAHIDDVLDVFKKLPESSAPIEYIICVQIIGTSMSKEIRQLKSLIELRILNKITMMADTAYRYGFNLSNRYKTVQVGIFKKAEDSFEVHEFVSNN